MQDIEPVNPQTEPVEPPSDRPTDGTGDARLARLAERAEALSHVGSWRLDRTTGQVVLSKEMSRILGLEPTASADAVTGVIDRSVHPDDRERIQRVTAAVMRGEAPEPVEYRIVRPDRSVRWVYSDAELETDGRGHTVALSGFVQDITGRKHEQMVTDGRLRLIEYAETHTLDELLEETLNEAEALTDSVIGFIDLVADDQTHVTLHASSTRTKRQFHQADDRRHHDLDRAGVWVDCVVERRPIIHNDFASLPDRKGWPEGHAPIVREMCVPVFRGDRIVAVVGVGNKPTPYRDDDVELLSRLADLVLDVVDRKRAHDDLRLSEALYRTLLQHAPDAICVERDGRVLFANEAHMTLFGYSSLEELQGLSPTDMVAPDDRTLAIERMRHARGNPARADEAYELTGLRRDGTTFPMLFRSAKADLPDGPATIVFHEDLSEIRRADEALRASEQKFKSAFNSAPVLMAIVDVETERLVDVSEEGLRISGFRRDELIGHTSTELGWMTAEAAGRMREEFMRHGPVRGAEMTRRAKDGSVVDILMFADPVTVAGRRCVLFTGIDITQRRKAERELAESRALQEAIGDSSDDFVWSVDPVSFKLTTFNRKLSDSIQRTRGVAVEVGMTPDEFFRSPEQRDAWLGFYREALARGSLQAEVETAAQRRFLALSLHALKRDDETFGISVFARDITEAKLAEQALRDSEARLRQSQKMEAVGRLAGGIAHDFNNLLTAIDGYAHLLEVDLPEGTTHEDARQIRNAAARATALTSKLLAFSGRQANELRSVNLAESVAALVPILSRVVPERIELIASLSPTAPLLADPAELDQVVLNLVVNSADAIPATGRIEIETSMVSRDAEAPPRSVSKPETRIRLSIRDTGAGMDEETIAHVFEPFFTTKPVGEGTGLGLATVYGVVERLGGSIEVESAPGAGTSFAVYLPPTAELSGEQPARSDAVSATGDERILLVEDEPAVRKLTRTLLERIGYQVVAAATPREALEVDAASYDLLITDVVMPGMDGPELARRLRSSRPALPVLFVSGYQPRLEGIGVEGPRTALLAKPFTSATLADAVRKVLPQIRPVDEV